MEGKDEKDRADTIAFLSQVVDSLLGSGEGDISMLTSLIEGVQTLNSFNAYLKKLKEEDPQLYEEMMKELFDILVDSFGITYAGFMIKRLQDNKIGYIDAYKIYDYKMGTTTIRDFTTETQNLLLNVAKEVNEEKWYDFAHWDCWYHVEFFFGGVNPSNYANDISSYYQKIIDMNNSTVKDIQTLFTEVYEIEKNYTTKVKAHSSTLTLEMDKLKAAVNRLVPVSAG